MNAFDENALAAWLPAPDGGPVRYVRRGALLVPAGLDTEPVPTEPAAAAQTEPGTDLQVAVVDAELVDRPGADGEADEQQTDQPEPLQEQRARLAWLPWRAAGDRDREGEVVSAEVLAEQLDADRALIEVSRHDELARRAADAEHQMALDDIAAEQAAVLRARQEQARDDAEAEKLAALHRHTASAGERARIAAEIGRTAEMRALRLAKAQKVATVVLLICLLGLGAWSTAGVHDGLVRLLSLEHGSAGWWAGWALEPILIAIVAGLIMLRAILKSSGGDVDGRAHKAEAVALLGSLALNLFGGWQPHPGGWPVSLGQAVAHSIGAIGAAGVAWLFGVVIDYFTNANPWAGAKSITQLVLSPSGNPSAGPCGTSSGAGPGRGPETAIRRAKRGPVPVDRGALPDDFRKLLDDVRDAITDGRLKPDPTAYSIYKQVMGNRGDRARSTEIAALVRGWRPLRAVDSEVPRAS
jgi:hypothetical protein